MTRGTYGFEVSKVGDLLNTADNVEALRQLWLERDLVEGYYLGPGDKGDFDQGAWHVACHLAGAGGVVQLKPGGFAWLEISHDPGRDSYFAGATFRDGKSPRTVRLDSADGRAALEGAKVLGFVEGNSTGRISARGIQDSAALFNTWRRQDFDHPPGSTRDGGKVWEHWCTLRDIRPSAPIGSSVLAAYVSLVSVLGDRFPATVARGRRDYGHPGQLAAMVTSGFTSRASAVWNTKPLPIPAAAEKALLASEPTESLGAIETLPWANPPLYYMYERKINEWSASTDVESDIPEA